MTDRPHIPVLCDPVVRALAPRDGDTIVDGTFGAGGYSEAILAAADCRVVGIDRDPTAIRSGQALVERYQGRLVLLQGRFSDMEELLRGEEIEAVQGVALDLGVSSMQLDQRERGFSFQQDGPLDMRMECDGESAADVVNSYQQDELADILYHYGEERRSRAVARAIIKAREEAAITRTGQLADIVARVLKKGQSKIHPATRTFQALRIHVNGELEELRRGLLAAERVLAPLGRLAVVSFHSLEDRQVKRFLTERSGMAARGSRHFPVDPSAATIAPSFHLEKRGAVSADEAEAAENPRARSAKLRWAVRTEAPAWTEAAA